MSQLDINATIAKQLLELARERQIDIDTLVTDLLASEQLNSLSQDILVTMSLDGRLLHANAALEKTLGYSADVMRKASFLDLVSPEYRKTVKQHLQSLSNGHKVANFRTQCCTLKGDHHYIEWSLHEKDGLIHAVGHAIAEADNYDQDLSEMQLFQSMANAIPYMVYIYDVPSASTVFANTFVLNYYATTLEELQADTEAFLADKIHPEDIANLQSFNSQWSTASDDDVFSNIYRTRGADNKYRWFRSYDTVFSRDKNGNVKQVLGTSVDITDQLNAEKLIHKQQYLLKQAARLSEIGAWEWDVTEDSFQWSSEVYDILEIPTNAIEPTFENFLEYVHPDDKGFVAKSHHDSLATGTSPPIEYRIVTASGQTKWLWSEAETFYNKEGEVTGLVGTLHDITQYKRIEERLQESEERYRALFEQATDGIVLIDPETTRFVHYNRAAYETLRYTGEAFGSLDMVTLGHEQHLSKALREGQFQEELLIPTGDGDICYLSVSTTTITLHGYTYLLSFWRDITQQKYIENALYFTAQAGWSENATEFLQGLVMYLTTRLDVDYAFIGELNETNNAVTTLVVSHREEMLKNFRYNLQGSPCEHVFRNNMAVFPTSVQKKFPKDTGLVRMEVEGYMGIQLWDSGGQPLGIIVLMSKKPLERIELAKSILQIVAVRAAHEIEQIHITTEMRESERRYRTLLENAPIALIIVNENKQIKFINRETSALFGYSPEELIDTSFDRLIPDTTRSRHVNHFSTFTEAPENRGMGVGLNVAGLRKDGTIFPADIALSHIVIEDEIHYVAFIIDLSDRLQAEQAVQLQQELEHEKELRELKSRFLSMVAHDFRTPLTLIMNSTGLVRMLGDRLTPEQRETSLSKIDRQVARLTMLLDEVSFINRNELSGHKLQLTPVRLSSFLRQIADEVTYSISTPMRVTIACSDSDEYLLDELLLHQIFTNLVSNAVKYSRPEGGKIVIACTIAGDWLRIDVSDKGIGIPQEEQKYIFEVFHRARNVGKIEGSGLGLAIVKTAVEAHGGRIDFESELDKGTTFSVYLPSQTITTEVRN